MRPLESTVRHYGKRGYRFLAANAPYGGNRLDEEDNACCLANMLVLSADLKEPNNAGLGL